MYIKVQTERKNKNENGIFEIGMKLRGHIVQMMSDLQNRVAVQICRIRDLYLVIYE